MQQEIRFASTPDRLQIAYARSGSGPPILRVGTFLTHLEHDWRSPLWRPWLTNFSRFHTFYRYDARGCGLSDREVESFALDALLGDMEAVVGATGLTRFALFGMSQGAAAAIWYAARHPERVSHLVVFGGYLRGRASAGRDAAAHEAFGTVKEMLRRSWASDAPGFQRWRPSYLLPEGTTEQIKWLADLQRASTTPDNAVRLFEGYNRIDVTEDARAVVAPTLVLHARDDVTVAFERGRDIAAHIPHARFVPLQSENHLLLPTEAAWPQFWRHVYAFLGVPEARYREVLARDAARPPSFRFADLTLRERDVLHLVAQGRRNREIADALALRPKTVRNYVSTILSKLDVASRGEAIVLARENGFGEPRA